VTLPGGGERTEIGRLVSGGDRGDTYSYDPPPEDLHISPELRTARLLRGPVRDTLVLDAALDLPVGLDADRRRHARTAVRLEAAARHRTR
jgi:alpha-mannosidase/mannosylglycerate hydrolase